MVENELYRAHLANKHSAKEGTIEAIRRRYHHSAITSEKTLDSLYDLHLPCLKCRFRQKIVLKRGLLPYAETRSIIMTMGGYPCSLWSHNIIYIRHKAPRELPLKYISLIVCNGCGFTHPNLILRPTGALIATHFLDFVSLS